MLAVVDFFHSKFFQTMIFLEQIEYYTSNGQLVIVVPQEKLWGDFCSNLTQNVQLKIEDNKVSFQGERILFEVSDIFSGCDYEYAKSLRYECHSRDLTDIDDSYFWQKKRMVKKVKPFSYMRSGLQKINIMSNNYKIIDKSGALSAFTQ